jgi:hypothetical protein
MAQTNANPKKLQIPRKNRKGKDDSLNQEDADVNWRAIEQWANGLNPIFQLLAGTGITLTPSDGLGPTVEITSTGGSGAVLGHSTLNSGPDFFQINAQAVFLGPTDQINTYFSYLDLQDGGTSGSFNTTASSWIVAVIGGQSVCLYPAFIAPAYTGGGIQILFQIQTWAINETNVAIYNAGPISVASGATYQSVFADFTLVHNAGGDISLVAGSGSTGVGLVSAAGGFYIASTTLTILVNAGTVFT